MIPLKPTARGKSRLGLDAAQRQALAWAFLLDVLAAVGAASDIAAVTVVCGPADAGRLPPEVRVHPDSGQPLNAELAAATRPDSGSAPFTLILMGDLPCATSASIETLVAAMRPVIAAGGPTAQAFLCDQPGVGSTALGGRPGALRPRFGRRSRALHRREGAVELPDPAFARMRRDVDSLPDLADAVRLGVGSHTQQACRDAGLVPGRLGASSTPGS